MRDNNQSLLYNMSNGKTVARVYSDGSFDINGEPSKDKQALADAIIDWTIDFGKTQHKWKIPQKPPCDCGAEKANTTHAGWCSFHQG